MNFSIKTIALLMISSLIYCKKSPATSGNNGNGNGDTTGNSGSNQPPVDPPVANTIGFFLDNWTPKNFTAPSYVEAQKPTSAITSYVTIDASNIITKVPQTVLGQNANIWMSQIVTEADLMNHLTNLKPGIIRFPGGSLSDVYFWNADPGVPPTDIPDSLLDANGNKTSTLYWFGKNTASWTMSLDNYYNLLQHTGSPGIITINYAYARYGTSSNPVAKAAHLAADWVRYDNGRTRYWEIGNESNGTWEAGYRINTKTNQDSQPEIITGALYGQHFKVFADSMRKAAQEIGKTIYIGAYLLEKDPEAWQTATDHTWNSGVLSQSNNAPDFYILHSYYTPYQTNSNANDILATASANTADMMTYIKNSITAAGQTVKPIALTEWNITSQGSMQQVSFVNGMHAAILLGEALKNKYGETSRWDLANGWNNGNDHGLFNIGDEPGVNKWNPRPAFYYMYYFQKMLGDRLINSTVMGDVLAYASSFTSGQKGVIVVNKNTTEQNVQIAVQNATVGSRYYWYTLAGGTDNGEFSRKVYVNGEGPSGISGGPSGDYSTIKAYSAVTQNGIRINMPPRSVVYVVID